MVQAKSRIVRYGLLLAVLVLTSGAFFALGPPKLLAKSETPEFCASCHVMESQYEDWFHEGAHRRKSCVECHLPHENVAAHYWWKSLDGMKDEFVFHSGRVPENIRISGHGSRVLRANCVRCHEALVEMIDTDRNCWECHRRVSHTRSGTIETN